MSATFSHLDSRYGHYNTRDGHRDKDHVQRLKNDAQALACTLYQTGAETLAITFAWRILGTDVVISEITTMLTSLVRITVGSNPHLWVIDTQLPTDEYTHASSINESAIHNATRDAIITALTQTLNDRSVELSGNDWHETTSLRGGQTKYITVCVKAYALRRLYTPVN